MEEKNSQSILVTERGVNDILHKIAILITLLAMGMMIFEFFSRGDFPSSRIGTFYIGILILYSLHKEAIHWLEDRKGIHSQRKGEYFVYGWILLAATLYLANFLTKDYFLFSRAGNQLSSLNEISFTTLEVCAVFILTRLFKIIAINYPEKK